jgi:SAM-dependent methyltransferase
VELSAATPAAVLWHELECGSYRADLPLWLELAQAHPEGPLLDVGAGNGRVALALARTGRRVVALDRAAELLAELRTRAAGLDVRTVCADARTFQLHDEPPFALCLVAMQTVQLLGASAGRMAFLRCARAHLRAGGLLACALVTDLEQFDRAAADVLPLPEELQLDGRRYRSQPIRLQVGTHTVTIERERTILACSDDAEADTVQSPHSEYDLVELDRLSAAQLEREGAAAGLRPETPRAIAATPEYSAGVVVMLRA